MFNEVISQSQYNKIVAISESEVGKIPIPSKIIFINAITKEEIPEFSMKTDIDKEIRLLQFANSINDLMVRFIRQEILDEETKIMVMERLYPIPLKKVSLPKRKKLFDSFESKISELHRKGFLHGDIQHPVVREPEVQFDNIILTKDGLRLIDTGFSALQWEVYDFFERLVREKYEINNFRKYFCG
jgi:tRNA A-37 threonylcarbamoyl transferase component Bud32